MRFFFVAFISIFSRIADIKPKSVEELISFLDLRTTLLGNTVSNTIPFVGILPNDKARILNELDTAIRQVGETELRRYREGIRSL